VSKSSGKNSGASAASFPTARPDSISEVTDPGSSGKRKAVQAALEDQPNYEGENCRQVTVKSSVPPDGRRKCRVQPAVQTQLAAFVTFAVDYFRKKALKPGVKAGLRHTTSEQLVSIYNNSLTSTDKEQGLAASMSFFKAHMVQLRILQRSQTSDEAMAKMGQSSINYGYMPLERCIEEKPDVADVIRWCQDYFRNSLNRILRKGSSRRNGAGVSETGYQCS
jgi:hypothetical protein